MPQARLPLWFLCANWLIVCAAFVLGAWIGRGSSLPDAQAKALRLVYDEIQRSYVDAIDGAALADRAIAAMARLDDYSRYIPEADVPRFVEETTGSYEGIGVLLHFADDGIFVRTPIEGGPGDRAGLLPGDRITAVGGARLEAMPPAERQRIAEERLRGKKGTTATIAVDRDGEERTFEVVRDAVKKRSVKWARVLDAERGLAYVHLADFHPGAAAELRHELARLQENAPLGGLVLDLRFNLGGSLDEAVAVARLFVAEGNLVSLRRRGSEVLERFDALAAECAYSELPLVAVINGMSASASEVLAGALQDHGRAQLVGERSYGKGVVNSIYEWQGLPFRLKLTTARYFTPKGRNIDGGRRRNGDPDGGVGRAADAATVETEAGGIAPDREVALDQAQTGELQRALADFAPPDRLSGILQQWSKARGLRPPGPLDAAEDPQLAAALACLQPAATGR